MIYNVCTDLKQEVKSFPTFPAKSSLHGNKYCCLSFHCGSGKQWSNVAYTWHRCYADKIENKFDNVQIFHTKALIIFNTVLGSRILCSIYHT